MSFFSTPDVTGQGGYAGGGGILGFLAQGLKGFEETHKMNEDEKEQKVENKQKSDAASEKQKMDESTLKGNDLQNTVVQAGLAQQQQATKEATATTTYDNVVRQALDHPDILKDPQILNGFLSAANVLNRPIPRNKDGTINLDALKTKKLEDLTVQEKAYYAGLDPASRKRQTRDIDTSGDPDFLSATAVQTYADETKREIANTGRSRASSYSAYVSHRDKMDDKKLPIWQRLEAAKSGMLEATSSEQKGYMNAKINEISSVIAKNGAEAAAIPQRLDLEGRSLQLRASQVGIAMQKLQNEVNPTSIANLGKTSKDLDDYTSKVGEQLDASEKTLATYVASKPHGVADPNDPLAKSLNDRIAQLGDQLHNAQSQSATARSMMMNYTATGRAITQNSGKPSTIVPRRQPNAQQPVGDAPGVADGTTGTMNGKRVVIRGGKAYPVQ